MSSDKKIQKVKKSDLSITILLIIGIAVVFNYFSYQIFYRWDLTENKIYSISKVSRDTVANLDDIVNIKVYFSKNLPQQFISLKQEIADILGEYENYANGNLKVEFIDPGDDESLKSDLYAKGIPPLTFQVYEKDKAQVVNGYMGIEINFADNIEVIPTIEQDTSNFEYQITKALKKVTSDNDTVIGYLTSNNTLKLNEEIQNANKVLSELYTIKEIKLDAENKKIPDGINTLIIAGPRAEFSEDSLKAINSFLVNGGSALFMIDGVIVDAEAGLSATANKTGLEKLLNSYGVKINNNLVLDKKAGTITFRQGNFPIPVSVRYSYWPMLSKDEISSEYSAVAGLRELVFPWISSIDLDEGKLANINSQAILSTSKNSWVVSDNFNLNPTIDIPQGATKESKKIAVFINGKLNNAYPNEKEKIEVKDSKLIVMGDSEFIVDNFLQSSPDNLKLFQNLVDSISLDDDLIKIRAKNISIAPLNNGEEIDDQKRNFIRYFNIFGVTVIVLLFGIGRYFIRKKSSFADEL